MQRASILLAGLVIFLATAFYGASGQIGPGVCTWPDCPEAGGGLGSTTAIESCLESTAVDTCTLAAGTYNQGATTLDIAVADEDKWLQCEPGTTITGTGDPVVEVTVQSNRSFYMEGCRIVNTGTLTALDVSSAGNTEISNSYFERADGETALLSGTLNGADFCLVGSITDADQDFQTPLDFDEILVFPEGDTGKGFATRTTTAPLATTLTFSPQSAVNVGTCGAGGTLEYEIYESGGSLRVYGGDTLMRSSEIVGGVVLTTNSLEIDDVRITATDNDITYPCLISNSSPTRITGLMAEPNCQAGIQVQGTAASGGTILSSVNVSGPIHLGWNSAATVFAGDVFVDLGSTTKPIVRFNSVANLLGKFGARGNFAGAYSALSAGANSIISNINIQLDGDSDMLTWTASDITNGTWPASGSGCIQTVNSEFLMASGTVVQEDCRPLKSPDDSTIDGDLTVTGAVTTGPSTTTGGSTSWHECEGAGSCPAADAGHEVFRKLPDDADPLAADKTVEGIRYCSFRAYDVGATIAVDDCIPAAGVDSDGLLIACGVTAGAPDTKSQLTAGCLVQDSAWLGTCLVYVGDTTWDASDQIDIGARLVEITSGTASEQEYTNKFTIIDDGTGCGASPRCADDYGVFEWDLDERENVGGSADGDGALLQIYVDALTGTVDNLEVMVDCPVW